MCKKSIKFFYVILIVYAFTTIVPVWAACNTNSEETGAAQVLDLQGQGNFDCSVITGAGECPEGDCTMQSIPLEVEIINDQGRKTISWNVSELSPVSQADNIFVTTQGDGSRCLYQFEPGAESGVLLEPAGTLSKTSIVACSDGVDDVVEEPIEVEGPISTTTNCAQALPGLQTAVDGDDNIITFIGVGTDKGLMTEGENDGDYVLAVCSSSGQTECIDQCRTPTDKIYTDTSIPGESSPLSERPCATSEELPTGNPDVPQYCWELSHQVELIDGAGHFIAPIELESGVAYWEQYKGSTCVKVTTSYRGFVYSYWAPAGCPN